MAVIDWANRRALLSSPGILSGSKLVTSLSSLMPCAIAGAGKLPAATTASRRPDQHLAASRLHRGLRDGMYDRLSLPDFRPLSPERTRRQIELTGDYSLSNSRTRASGLGTRLLLAFFGISAVSALVAGAADLCVFRSRTLANADRPPHRPDPGLARSVALGRTHRNRRFGPVRRHHRAADASKSSPGFPVNRAKLRSFLNELRDGGISAERLAPIEG